MGFMDAAKKSFLANFNIKEWLGIRILKQSTGTVLGIYKDLKGSGASNKELPKSEQSFADLMAQNGITEEILQKRLRRSLSLVWVYALCFVVVLIYSLYLVMKGFYDSSIFSLVLVLVFLSFMFKEHFNYFQMKERRLGCTFKDWFTALFRGNAK